MAVVPGGAQKRQHSLSWQVWYARLIQDVIYAHTTVPRRPGPRKTKAITRPQHAFLSVRWLEVIEDQEPGTLYEWDDGDIGGSDTIDRGCPENSFLCRVEFTVETAEGGERYRLSEEEASRVVDKDTRTPNNSDSDGDNSSDGVEDDFRVGVMQERCNH